MVWGESYDLHKSNFDIILFFEYWQNSNSLFTLKIFLNMNGTFPFTTQWSNVISHNMLSRILLTIPKQIPVFKKY